MRAVLAATLAQWRSRPPRLPRPVLALLAFALLLALALGVIDFRREGLRLEGRLRGATARLAEVRSLATALSERDAVGGKSASTQAGPSGQNPGSLLARTDAALRAVGLSGAASRLEPQGTAVQVELGPHDWPQFARLLEQLARQGIDAAQARVEAVEAEPMGGRVQARLRLTEARTP